LNGSGETRLQRKIKWGLDYPEEYCCHVSTGRLQFDPGIGTKHYDPWWMLLIGDTEIQKLYAWYMKRWGLPVILSTHWGCHVSVIKHEEPPDKSLWGNIDPAITFRYSSNIRWENGTHAWLDVYCPQLSEIRQEMGLPAKEWFHLTIGRLY
jgi:hypothetical protein